MNKSVVETREPNVYGYEANILRDGLIMTIERENPVPKQIGNIRLRLDRSNEQLFMILTNFIV